MRKHINPLDGGGKQVTITTAQVDISLLRFQRDALLEELDTRKPDELGEVMSGLVNLLDSMLDNAEGFTPVLKMTPPMLKMRDVDLAELEKAMEACAGAYLIQQPESSKIIVVMEGGVIHDIRHIPPGVTVEVRDFDVEGVEPAELMKTEDGDEYTAAIWN